MLLKYSKVHNRFKLNGIHYTYESLKDVAYGFIKEGELFEKSIGEFLNDWLDHKTYVEVTTSGSTGKPKTIKLDKQAMVNSAIATGDFFNLRPSNTALHCLPSNFIAGKMMLVRAMILGLELDLVEPTSSPLKQTRKTYDFCAMTPFQVEKSLDDINKIRTLIIGGAQVNKILKQNLQDKKVEAFETYGMTETITHIAAKELNVIPTEQSDEESQAYFKILPDISISQDDRDCLVIEAPKLSKDKIVTNDIVKLHSKNKFEWLGRYDNVINSGGVKFFPEQIEKKLSEIINHRFFIASQEDKQLGEKVILVIEIENLDSAAVLNEVKSYKSLSKYEIPKQIYTLPKFIETTSGKIQRQKTLELIMFS